MPRSYVQVFVDPPVVVQTGAYMLRDKSDVVARLCVADPEARADRPAWYEIEFFVPVSECRTVAQAFDSMARELLRLADELEGAEEAVVS